MWWMVVKGGKTCVQEYSSTVEEAPAWAMRRLRLVDPAAASEYKSNVYMPQ